MDEEISSRSAHSDYDGELGESQGYDQSVDSSQLENYDYYEDIGKKWRKLNDDQLWNIS